MKTIRLTLVFTLLCLAGLVWAEDDERVSASEAINHVGEFAMVCGVVVATHRERNKYFPDPRSQDDSGGDTGPSDVTYLYFDQPAPEHEFAAAIMSKHRKEFTFKPASLEGRKACVYGEVKRFEGKAMINLIRAEQIATE
jgi:hypothetical protein